MANTWRILPTLRKQKAGRAARFSPEMAVFRRFSQLARLLQSLGQRRNDGA
ncbi:MAG TPA: hypothetical protein VH326_02880 [Sphingomonas sp.]|jgi:hypothetical protein|nr:hypothetical protein [Sphingomonas sp.]